MCPVSIHDLAEQALSMTQDMYALATEQNWVEVNLLEHDRQQVLEHLFQLPGIDAHLVNIADKLERIIEIDKQSIELTVAARDQVKQDYVFIKQRKNASHVYLQHDNS